MSEGFGARSLKRKNVKGLALNAPAPRNVAPSESDAQIPGALGADDFSYNKNRTSQLEIGLEYRLDLKKEDLEVLKELGSGNGGTVSKVRHIATNTVMARKVIHVEAKKEIRRRIVRELHIMHECKSEHIVTFYGAFLSENNDVIMCMEYMDVGALDRISRDFGPIRIDVLGKIAEATLGGLSYLYDKHHIMHRDIKPSNVLVNSKGNIKLCDFGVSGELVNSIADTFVGTSTYMAPERIQGEKYTVKSDVWSFGLTIMELAIGKFPFESESLEDSDGAPAGILDLLQQIVHEPAPRLPPSDAFPPILDTMLQKCMQKEPEKRPTPQNLYEKDHFVQAAKRTPVDLREWAVGLMEKNNRKSHLAPQLSPSTQDLLRGNDSPPIRASQTPTSGEIPIGGADIRSAFVSPREQTINNIRGSRSPRENGSSGSSSLGRAGGAAFPGQRENGSSSVGRAGGAQFPGLGPRSNTSDRIPKTTTINAPERGSNGIASASATQDFALPIRPAPAGPLPPPPPMEPSDKENRRQATIGGPASSNSGYGSGSSNGGYGSSASKGGYGSGYHSGSSNGGY